MKSDVRGGSEGEKNRGGIPHVGILITVIVVSLVLFAALSLFAVQVPYFPWDVTVEREVQSFSGPGVAQVMDSVGQPGYGIFAVAFFGGILVVLLLVRWTRVAIAALFSMFLVGVLGTPMRYLIDRPRPSASLVHVQNVIEGGHYSYPSGHVMSFFSFFGFLCYAILHQMRPTLARSLLLLLIILYAVTVIISRIYVGEHWPSDVLGGLLVGAAALAGTIWFYEWLERRNIGTSNKGSGNRGGARETR